MDWYNYTGNLADWVMAGAAVGGFLLARDYFSDIIKKDGYELLKKLHLQLIPQVNNNLNLSAINLLDLNLPRFLMGENGVMQDEDEESNLRKELENDLIDLKERLSKSYKLDREITSILNDIEMYGWHIKPKSKSTLVELLIASKKTFLHVHNIVLSLEQILSRNEPDFLPPDLNTQNLKESNLPLSFRSTESLCELITKSQKSLLKPDKETPYTIALDLYQQYYSIGKHFKLYYFYKK